MSDNEIEIESLPESMWQLKPWWCQPWTIVLTGIAISAGSWLLLHKLFITLPIILLILGWWIMFLVIVPTQYSATVKEARREQYQATSTD